MGQYDDLYNYDQNSPYNGTGQYDPFVDLGNSGNPTYIPPVPTNPLFIPPSYIADSEKSLTINLIAEDDNQIGEFFEDGVSKGFGNSINITYSPSTTFGSKRVYTFESLNVKSLYYYEVEIVSKYKDTLIIAETIRPAFDPTILPVANMVAFGNYYDFNYTYNIAESISAIQYQYDEQLIVKKYVWNGNTYQQDSTIPYDRVYGAYTLNFETQPTPNVTPVISDNQTINYEVAFTSNFSNELGDLVQLNYQIFYKDSVVDSDTITLLDGNTDNKQLENSIIKDAEIAFTINSNIPNGYSVLNYYYTTKVNALTQQYGDYSKWNTALNSFKIPANILSSGGIAVAIVLEKEIKFEEPSITLNQIQYDIRVKESDTEKITIIPFLTQNADYVLVYLSPEKTLRVPASDKQVSIYFEKDFNKVYGSKKIIVVPYSDNYGSGERVECILTYTSINDYPSITEITYAENIDIPSFSDGNIDYTVAYSSFAASSVDIFLKLRDNSITPLFQNQPENGNVNINLKKLRDTYPNWVGSNSITLIIRPYNNSGIEPLVGNDYEVTTNLIFSNFEIDETILEKVIYDAFAQSLSIIEPESESKYLTHLANFNNNEQIIISSWETDDFTLSKKSEDNLGNVIVKTDDIVNSIILKLYTPLPANVSENSTFWITKLMSNPLIETIVLTEQDDLKCPPLKGPNFNIEVDFVKGQSTNFESLDNIIFSAETTTSEKLVATYLSSSFVDTDDLNIEYISGSDAENGYLWNNFVHFSSAKERVDNFVYKVQLIELYENLALSASTDLLDTGFINSPASVQELERQKSKKSQLINGFDGFEKTLFNSSSYSLYNSSSITWPYSASVRVDSSSPLVTNDYGTGWYDTIITLAENFDNNNQNWVQNNIPQYIVNDGNNASLLLFLSMVGQHFDNIYYHTKSIEKSRGLGYKSKNGISDKLLFDTLKSLSWDAKNLSADSSLWNYTFGVDSNSNVKETNPAKQRTNEVWRRIINNLPYLLKHKGSRRGIYALLSCYGIPSSNLSILEFGGPEINDESKGKLITDVVTTVLNMNSGSSIELEWKNTDTNRKPDTIELFVKPNYAGAYQLISGSGWNVALSGSIDSKYGTVKLSISESTNIQTITSNLLPIFNNRFFGIEVSRTVGSGADATMSLNLKQFQKERTIFEYSGTLKLTQSNWDSGSTIRIGNNYTGSLDEFRLWSTPLDKDRFFEHVSYPEMINGNNYSSSTSDLYFRLDFEYPKNLYGTNGTSSFINVANNIFYPKGFVRNQFEETGSIVNVTSTINAPISASVIGFTSSPSYPYQFEAIDRSVTLEIPNIGSSRFSTNKVRFESQTDFSGNDVSGGVDLSYKSRATKKAFDQSPPDSNRVGLFFSPTKELNLDIAKSLGGFNLDNYIGNPSDLYKEKYTTLDDLRKYYFERFDGRDIYQYINLIKLYEKSMFEDIKQMLPARVKATTGLLIEPHFLERSKVQHKKPSGEYSQWDATISKETNLSGETDKIETQIYTNTVYDLSGENNQYETTITNPAVEKLIANSYQYNSEITASDTTRITFEYSTLNDALINTNLNNSTIISEIDLINSNTIVGQNDYEVLGFGIYGQNGSAIRTYYDARGNRKKERVRVSLIKEQNTREFTYLTGSASGSYTELGIQTYYETKLTIQPFSGSVIPSVGGKIVEVVPINGYLKSHYRNTSDLTRGLQNSFYYGTKNTSATTLDGSSPVEVFATNPNILKVNKAGRDASEPILEVE